MLYFSTLITLIKRRPSFLLGRDTIRRIIAQRAGVSNLFLSTTIFEFGIYSVRVLIHGNFVTAAHDTLSLAEHRSIVVQQLEEVFEYPVGDEVVPFECALVMYGVFAFAKQNFQKLCYLFFA